MRAISSLPWWGLPQQHWGEDPMAMRPSPPDTGFVARDIQFDQKPRP